MWIAIHALLNSARGRGIMPKWVYYPLFALLSFFVLHYDVHLLWRWIVVCVLYATAPWQAMFSAIHGRAPGRNDSWPSQYVVDFAKWLTKPTDDWHLFGIVYGMLRGLYVLPGLYLVSAYTGHWDTFVLGTIAFSLLGVIYWGVGRIVGEQYSVFTAEPIVGAILGVLQCFG